MLFIIAAAAAFSSPSLAVGRLPAAHALRQPVGVAMQEEAPDAAPDVKAVGIKGSSLNLNKEDLALRNEKRAFFNKAIPAAVFTALAVSVLGGDSIKNIEMPDMGPGPPGMAEGRALKERSRLKSEENMKKMREGGGAPELY